MNEDLLPVAAAAASFIGLSRRQVYRLVEEGHLPCVRKGSRMFFRKSELERAFATERAIRPQTVQERKMTLLGREVTVRLVGRGGW